MNILAPFFSSQCFVHLIFSLAVHMKIAILKINKVQKTHINDSLLIVSLVFLSIVNANTGNGNNGSICIHGVTANGVGMTMREASSDQEQTTSAMTSMTSQVK